MWRQILPNQVTHSSPLSLIKSYNCKHWQCMSVVWIYVRTLAQYHMYSTHAYVYTAYSTHNQCQLIQGRSMQTVAMFALMTEETVSLVTANMGKVEQCPNKPASILQCLWPQRIQTSFQLGQIKSHIYIIHSCHAPYLGGLGLCSPELPGSAELHTSVCTCVFRLHTLTLCTLTYMYTVLPHYVLWPYVLWPMYSDLCTSL